MNLTERIRVDPGSFDQQSKDDMCHYEQEDTVVTSVENILLQDGHDNLEPSNLEVPTYMGSR